MDAEYRLFVQSQGRPHFAVVRVRYEAHAESAVDVAEDSLPAATSDADGYKREAADGARYALAAAAQGGHVTITNIGFTHADTGPGDVKYAAAQAVWEAMGWRPDTPPVIEGSEVWFPEL